MKQTLLGLLLFFFWTCSLPESSPEFKSSQKNVREVGRNFEVDVKKRIEALTKESPLQDYLELGVSNQPEVAAAYYEWKGSYFKSKVESSLEDPRLTFQADIKTMVMSFMPGLMFDIFGPGKRVLRRDVSLAEADANYYRFRRTVLNALHSLFEIYYRYHMISRKIAIHQTTLRILGDVEKISRAGFEVGRLTLIDALRSQVEQSRIKLEIRNLEDSKNPLLSAWSASLGLDPQKDKSTMPDYTFSRSEFFESAQIYEVAFENNPSLKQMEAELKMAEKALELANKSKVPDFAVGLMTDFAVRPTMFRPVGFVTLPIWREKIEAMIESAASAKEGAKSKYKKESIQLAVDFAEKLYSYREIERGLNSLKIDFLPKLEKTLEVGLSGYSANKIDFITLLTIQREVLELQISEVELEVEREILIAEIKHLLMGIPLGKIDERVLRQ
ncbi:hypothetical protein CH373_09255 [Leptospira perolatii]|uniref:Channel protein TolC n=1 Tax=Leptospira perolatii TaxID=2023191 RepID=A0A2M9ZNU6_9LEPT|nr:TolC family protein [Leptospira perolatii]PJZ69674.1 hypothetical protein CH360_10400 [Leptospira perolatii]PJZ73661.1 hypothetical protein CH373_09255 [Leptospira perolatii]